MSHPNQACAPVKRGHYRSALAAAISMALCGTTLADERPDRIDEIIVSAQKREQSLQEVPISLQVVSGGDIQRLGVLTFDQLDTYVPNLVISKSPSTYVINMRGIGSGAGSLSVEQSVVMFVDGVYGGRGRQFQAPFMDVQRIEILRGPQGALVGKNTSAGAINIISARPTDELERIMMADYDFELSGGSVTGIVSGPVTDRLGLRLAANYGDYDGYIRNSLNGKDEPGKEQTAVRGTAVYGGDLLEAILKLEYADYRTVGSPFQLVSANINRPLDRNKETGSSLGDEADQTYSTNLALTLNMDISDHTLTSITGYSRYSNFSTIDADFFEADLAFATFDEAYEQVSQELRLLSPVGEQFEYIVGAYVHTSRLNIARATGIVFAPPASSYREYDQSGSVLSAFGQLTYNITDDVRANAALRYTFEKKNADFAIFGGPLAATQFTGTLLRSFSDRLRENEVDPSVSLQWDVSDNLMTYASYARGSKGGGFQGAISNAEAATFRFESESSSSLESGMKWSLDRGFFNLTAYFTEYKDLQLSVALPSTGAAGFDFFTGNAGEARAYGLESDALYRLTDNFVVRGSLAFLNGKFTDYPSGPCPTGVAPDGEAPGSCTYNGVKLPFAPRWSGSVSGEYDQNLTSNLTLRAGTTVSFRSSARMESGRDPGAIQGGYAKVDVRLGIGDANDRWEIALLAKNLTDRLTIGFSPPAALANNPFLGITNDGFAQTLDPPRTFAVQGMVRF